MSELLTQTRVEDGASAAEAFMQAERGVSLDGGFAGNQVAEHVTSVQLQAMELLQARPVQGFDGLYEPLGKGNIEQFDLAVTALPGHMVLVPSTLVENGTSQFYPAVVSEDGIKEKVLRLHVLRRPYRRHLGYGAAMVLSAAGQAETKGVGKHRAGMNDGVEAEHFATLLAAGSDPSVRVDWRAGRHINHTWRQQADSSVTTQVSQRLFGQDVPQSTVTLTKAQVRAGQARIFWHEGMCDEHGNPETATRQNALVVIQGLGFTALKERDRQAIDEVKGLLDG